jgi:hypothetical protein
VMGKELRGVAVVNKRVGRALRGVCGEQCSYLLRVPRNNFNQCCVRIARRTA